MYTDIVGIFLYLCFIELHFNINTNRMKCFLFWNFLNSEYLNMWLDYNYFILQVGRGGHLKKITNIRKKIKLKLYVTPFDLLVHETKILPLEQMK